MTCAKHLKLSVAFFLSRLYSCFAHKVMRSLVPGVVMLLGMNIFRKMYSRDRKVRHERQAYSPCMEIKAGVNQLLGVLAHQKTRCAFLEFHFKRRPCCASLDGCVVRFLDPIYSPLTTQHPPLPTSLTSHGRLKCCTSCFVRVNGPLMSKHVECMRDMGVLCLFRALCRALVV